MRVRTAPQHVFVKPPCLPMCIPSSSVIEFLPGREKRVSKGDYFIPTQFEVDRTRFSRNSTRTTMAERDSEYGADCEIEVVGERFEGVFNRREWEVQRRRQMRKVMGAFTVFCVGALVVSMVGDSLESNVSREILLREAQFQVSKLVQTKSKAGGLKALDRFASRLVALDDSSANATSSTEAGGNPEANDADETKPPAKSIVTDVPDRGPPGVMQPGWGSKTSWGTGDWAIWLLLGPVLTVIAVVFMYYMYGWQAALALCVCLVAVDVLAFYLNI